MDDRGSTRALLFAAAERAARYIETIPERRVSPSAKALDDLARLGGPLPEQGEDPLQVLAQLDEVGSPATVATTGGRYFGFVVGGALPATLAAHWLAGAWDQNASLRTLSPVGTYLEDVALTWIVNLLGLPPACGGAFVTGGQMAN